MTDKTITSAELLTMRAQAADAENAVITATRHIDRMTRAYAALEIEVVKLQARLEAAERDAERYRWLRDKSPAGWRMDVEGLWLFKFDYDAAIDAMKEQQP